METGQYFEFGRVLAGFCQFTVCMNYAIFKVGQLDKVYRTASFEVVFAISMRGDRYA